MNRRSQFIHRKMPVQNNVAVTFDLISQLKKEQSASIQIGRKVRIDTFDGIFGSLFSMGGKVTHDSPGHCNVQRSIDEYHEIDKPSRVSVGSP